MSRNAVLELKKSRIQLLKELQKTQEMLQELTKAQQELKVNQIRMQQKLNADRRQLNHLRRKDVQSCRKKIKVLQINRNYWWQKAQKLCVSAKNRTYFRVWENQPASSRPTKGEPCCKVDNGLQ
eukprot:TRINITY_DN2726_c0_g1_i4.p1 TRINITY_DN2726_c0_g1~~TRINITY_DN2726_c0_g1_i4.p1  ORF type:complete len:124 (+),score=22.11 TRINITY_DN2726_c0_g1_i4:731-1102(+)